ncbi:hypothetical protein CCHR01_15896 [Colletotrichum chrysophilum]|uniref:Uncharacterized protein n=1 Tax=Colletotrichum chrysophilum TaxID=1836956 RepID=A0AAD9EAY5_9PEZI|nr:hypothetical protein CCHR01_15896 [Colletotrichum chrysophilum]
MPIITTAQHNRTTSITLQHFTPTITSQLQLTLPNMISNNIPTCSKGPNGGSSGSGGCTGGGNGGGKGGSG